jgi:hypothetical protein
VRVTVVSTFMLAAASVRAEPAQKEQQEGQAARELTSEEIDAWLDSRNLESTRDGGSSEFAEAPPPAPRHRGVVLESSLGALGHLGPLRNVSPTAPWFHVKLGLEALDWLMLFVESDLAVASTAFGHSPPPPRSYALTSFGGGLRLTLEAGDFGVYLQGDAGGALVTEDVLAIYGYEDATSLGAYFGGSLGVELHQISPHYALALHGGVRDYPVVLARQRSSQPPLVWLGGVALRYAF